MRRRYIGTVSMLFFAATASQAFAVESEDLPLAPLVEEEQEAQEEQVAGEQDASSDEAKTPSPPTGAASSARPTLLTGARLALVFPTGRVSMSGAVALDLQWRSPIQDGRFGLALDVGWYRLAGEGSQIDPGMGVFEYRWSAHGIPVHFGFVYEPPLQALLDPFVPGLWPFVETGLAFVPVISYGTFSNEEGHVFLADNRGHGLAFGLYLGAGAAYPLGPGELLGVYRWTTARTDMDYPWINPESGDIHGNQLFVGYRLTH